MDFDIKTTYNYLISIDDYIYKHFCSKSKCIICPIPDACDFLFKFLTSLEKTIDKEKIV